MMVLGSLENKLDLATQQNGQETAQFVEQQSHISELSASLREREILKTRPAWLSGRNC